MSVRVDLDNVVVNSNVELNVRGTGTTTETSGQWADGGHNI